MDHEDWRVSKARIEFGDVSWTGFGDRMAKSIITKQHQVYMSGDNGPFKCSNCEYYVADNTCDQKDIIKLAGEGKFGLSLQESGNAEVDPDGCSDYFEPR